MIHSKVDWTAQGYSVDGRMIQELPSSCSVTEIADAMCKVRARDGHKVAHSISSARSRTNVRKKIAI